MSGVGAKLAFRPAIVESSTCADTRRGASVDESKDFPSWAMFATCPTLCPLKILDLQRDLHANNLAFALPFLSKRLALRSMLGSLPPTFVTLQLFASVTRRLGCVFLQHVALLVLLKFPTSF